jgi:hypothetical protein
MLASGGTMHRSAVRAVCVLASVLALLSVIVVGVSRSGAEAQDVTTQDHPLVGTWLINADPDNMTTPSDTVAFHADGTVTDVEIDGTVELGGWEATGPTSAAVTLWGTESDENGGFGGMAVVRVSLEVSADGASVTGQYTIEFQGNGQPASGQAGPATVTGTRLTVEAPGTPVMGMDVLFGSFGGTPEATPAG